MLHSNQSGEQAGSRGAFSTIDHIHTVNQVIEKTNEYRKPLCMAFINYEKTYNSVETTAALSGNRSQGAGKI